MKLELTIKHLAPYLPYGLKCHAHFDMYEFKDVDLSNKFNIIDEL